MNNPDAVLTTKEVGARLKLHRNTIMKLVNEKAFPNAFQIGVVWRIPEADVQKYIAGRQAASAKQLAVSAT